MNLPSSGAAAGGLVDSIWIKPNLLDSTAAETVAGDDLNIIIVSVRPAPVANDDARVATRVVVEQNEKGQPNYDLLIEAPKEKTMLDSTESSPDHYSGRPFESSTAQAGQCSPDHNSGHRLDPRLD